MSKHGDAIESLLKQVESLTLANRKLRAALERIERRRKPSALVVQMEQWEWVEVAKALASADSALKGD